MKDSMFWLFDDRIEFEINEKFINKLKICIGILNNKIIVIHAKIKYKVQKEDEKE